MLPPLTASTIQGKEAVEARSNELENLLLKAIDAADSAGNFDVMKVFKSPHILVLIDSLLAHEGLYSNTF